MSDPVMVFASASSTVLMLKRQRPAPSFASAQLPAPDGSPRIIVTKSTNGASALAANATADTDTGNYD